MTSRSYPYATAADLRRSQGLFQTKRDEAA